MLFGIPTITIRILGSPPDVWSLIFGNVNPRNKHGRCERYNNCRMSGV
jgi:hypothetical protein